MIPSLSIIFIVISALLCFLIPVLGYKLVAKGPHKYAGVLIGGALSFFLSQMVVRIPIMQLYLPNQQWYLNLGKSALGMALFLGFTAALFETMGRLFTLNLLLKKSLSYRTGVIHGLGHGGIEAILLVGLNYVIFAFFGLYLNSGVQEPLLFIIPHEQQALIKSLLVDTPSYLFIIAGIERSLTIIVHISLSLLITVGIMKKQLLKYTLITISIHTLLDAIIVFVSYHTSNVYILEGIVFVFALISIIIIIKLKNTIPEMPHKDEASQAVDEGY